MASHAPPPNMPITEKRKLSKFHTLHAKWKANHIQSCKMQKQQKELNTIYVCFGIQIPQKVNSNWVVNKIIK